MEQVKATSRAAPVLHVLDHALPEVTGYSIRSHHVLRALRGAGIAVVAVLPDGSLRRPASTTIDDVEYVRVPARVGPSMAAMASGTLRFAGQVRRLARERNASLVHAHSPSRIGAAGWLAARRARLPFVYEWRGLWEESAIDRGLAVAGSPRHRLSRGLETFVVRHADALVCLSEGLHREATERGIAEQRIHLAPNGADVEGLRPPPADAMPKVRFDIDDPFVVGYLGYFFAYEGIDVLLDAFAIFRQEMPRARLLLVGSGDEENALRERVRRLGIETDVMFTGPVAHDAIAPAYAACDLVVYPRRSTRSTERVTPLKPLEAMAMGRTIIASRVGGLAELIVDGSNGVLSTPGDIADLARTLSLLSADAAARARLARTARRFAESRSWTDLAHCYAPAYAAAHSERTER